MVTQSKLKALETGTIVPNGGSSLNSDCCVFAAVEALFDLQFYFICAERGALERRYEIEGNGCGACCVSVFCHPCAQTQHVREIEEEENAALSKGAPQY